MDKAVPPPACREKAVDNTSEAMSGLEDVSASLDNLSNSVSMLEGRISPALCGASESRVASPIIETESELSSIIQAINYRVKNINNELNEIIERVRI